MTDKEMIEEMARDIAFEFCPNRHLHKKWGNEAQCYSDDNFSECTTIKNAVDKLYEQGYRKIPEGSVVLSEGEYSDIIEDEVKTLERDIAEYWACSDIASVAQELRKDGYRKLDDHAIMTLRKAKGLEERIRKETARDILNAMLDIKPDFSLLDGCTPSEFMRSVDLATNIIFQAVKEQAKQFGVEIKE